MQMTWDKCDDENRYVNIPKQVMSILTMFIAMRNRIFEQKDLGRSPDWFLDEDSHLFLNLNGNKYNKIILNELNGILLREGILPEGTNVTPYNYRRYFCTYMNYHSDPNVQKHALRQAGHGGKAKNNPEIFEQNYDLNQAKNAEYIQTTINKELKNENLIFNEEESSIIEDDRKKLKDNMKAKSDTRKERNCEEFEDLLGASNPVGVKLKERFSRAADIIDSNWKMKEDETFRGYKTRLLKIILEDSDAGQETRDAILKMYRGNGVWSLRHSINLKKNKVSQEKSGHQGLREILFYISQWDKNKTLLPIETRVNMFKNFVSKNFEFQTQKTCISFEEFCSKLKMYSKPDLRLFVDFISSKDSNFLISTKDFVYCSFKI